jgi:hypothetical protein
MRARDAFGAAVRTIGFWFLVQSAQSALWFVWRTHGGGGSEYVPQGEHVGGALIYMVTGLIVLLLADPIVWLFYGLPPKSSAPPDAH